MSEQSANVIRIGGMELRFLVDETNGSGSVVVFEFTVLPNARVPVPHYHKDVDEVVYALEGTLTTTCDGQKHPLRAGNSLFLPRGCVHAHENLHPETAKALIVLTPGSIGRRYFEEIAAVLSMPGKPDRTKVEEVMLRHGLVPA